MTFDLNTLSYMRPATRQEVARTLRIQPGTVSEWVRKKRIPGCMPGTRRYDLDAVLAQLDTAKPSDSPQPVDEFSSWLKDKGYEV